MTAPIPPADGLPDDDREVMAQLTESMADLLRRIAEFQEEMAPFLPLFDGSEGIAEGSTPGEDPPQSPPASDD